MGRIIDVLVGLAVGGVGVTRMMKFGMPIAVRFEAVGGEDASGVLLATKDRRQTKRPSRRRRRGEAGGDVAFAVLLGRCRG